MELLSLSQLSESSFHKYNFLPPCRALESSEWRGVRDWAGSLPAGAALDTTAFFVGIPAAPGRLQAAEAALQDLVKHRSVSTTASKDCSTPSPH